MKITELLGEGWNRRDSYQRDYDFSRTGFGRPPREDDEYVNGDQDEVDSHRQYMARHADVPHDVHIDGRKWKTFDSHSHASNVARKLQANGKKATVVKSMSEEATAGGTSAGMVSVGAVHKNKSPKMQKPTDNALDGDNLMTGGSIKR
jgi:hypothetical protein